MPMYDYRCPEEHVFESLEKVGTSFLPCLECFRYAYKVILKAPAYRQGNANRLNMVVHQNEAGEYSFPGDPKAPTAEGFQRVEISDVSHARRIEQDMSRREHVKAQEHQHETSQYYDAVRKREQDDLRSIMGDFSPKGKRFAEAALKDQANKSQERSAKPTKGGACYFEALSFDKTNREPHRDANTDWKGVE